MYYLELLTFKSLAYLSWQISAGSNSFLTGGAPALVVEEMQASRPSYTASYQPVGTGPYQVSATMLATIQALQYFQRVSWRYGGKSETDQLRISVEPENMVAHSVRLLTG